MSMHIELNLEWKETLKDEREIMNIIEKINWFAQWPLGQVAIPNL